MVKDCKPFQLDRDQLYICCHHPFRLPNGKYSGMIRVYELQTPEKNPNMLTNMDWCFTPEIIDPNTTTGYNSLMINGQSVDYNKLVQDLCQSRLRVNRRGHCYFQLNVGITDTTETYGITFYRMNDLWKWSDYGVKVDLLTDEPLMNWNRLYILDGSKPTEVSNNQDILIKHQLEEAKLQLKEKNYEVITLKSQVYQKDGENQTLKNQVNQKDGENKTLKNQIERQDSVISQKITENQTLTAQVKKLQSELEDAKRNRPQSSSSLTKAAVPRNVFVLKSIPFSWPNYNTYTMYWTVTRGVPKVLTPSHEAVNSLSTTFPIPVTFNLIAGNSFDVNNWFYMRVKERTAPILIYEGNACSLSVGGHVMSSPIQSSTIINWGSYVVRGQTHFDFVPVALTGYGTRVAILQY